MVIWVAAIAAVTLLLVAILVCSAIMTRPKTPCLFQGRYVYVGESRIGDGLACTGPADNTHLSRYWPSGVRVCDHHVPFMLDAADAMNRQWQQ